MKLKATVTFDASMADRTNEEYEKMHPVFRLVARLKLKGDIYKMMDGVPNVRVKIEEVDE